MDLINSGERSGIAQAFTNLHDTFKRPFYVYKKAEVITMSMDANYNFGYGVTESTPGISGYNVESGIISGRIAYLDKQLFSKGNRNPNSFVGNEIYKGDVRLRLDQSGYNFFKDAGEIIVDDVPYNIKSTRKHGFFGPAYWDIFLEES